MDTKARIDSACIEVLIDWWSYDRPPEWARPGYAFFNRVARALRKAGPTGVRFLKDQFKSENDPRKKSIVLLELSHKQITDTDVIRYLVETFYEDDLRWKECALAGLIRSGDFVLERSEVERLIESDYKGAAAAAMDYLSCAYPSEEIGILRDGLRNASPYLRAHACSKVGDRNIQELKEEVRTLLQDEDKHVRIAAQIAIERCDIEQLRA